MAPAASIRNTSLLVGAIAVLCAAVLALLIARSLTRPIVQLTEAVQGVASNGQGRHSGRRPRRDRRAGARICAGDRGGECEDRRARTRGCRSIAAPRRRATIMPSANACSARRSNPPTTPSSRCRSTAPSPAGIRRRSASTATARRKQSARTSRCSSPTTGCRRCRTLCGGSAGARRIEHNETVRLRKDGSPIEVSLSISPIKSPSGAIIGISKVARDITDSQQDQAGAAAADRGASPHLRDLAGSDHGDGFAGLSRADQPELRGHTGLSAGGNDRPQRRSTSSIPTISRIPARRCARRGAGERPKISDTRCIHKNGREVWLSWLGTWSEPAKRFFFVGRDMTESRLAQETLRESEQLARGIIDTALDAFVQIDDAGHHPGLECAGREHLRLAARRSARQECVRTDRPAGRRGPLKTSLQAFLLSGGDAVRQPPPRARGQAARRQGDHGRTEHHRAADARRLRVQRIRPRPHRQDRGRGTDPAGREDGSGRPAHRRHRARLQQHPDRDHRDDRNPGRRRARASRSLPPSRG